MPVKIHGKAYETVSERLQKFREQHPAESGWSIVTEIIEINDEKVLIQAKIVDDQGKVVGTGLAEEYRDESLINKTSAVENCETSAIGRALMAAGFGSGEYCSADELVAALARQKEIEEVLKQAEVVANKSEPLSNELKEYLQKEGVELQESSEGIIAVSDDLYKKPTVRNELKKAGFKWNGKNWIR
jgi:archaellum component FlaC